jgi:ATP/ADP translocase
MMGWLLSRVPDVDRAEMTRLLALMGLFFLVVLAIGILRPIKNAVALGGLGESEFYKVYGISAAVVGFVPLYNWIGGRVPWRRMISATAVLFAAVLLLFRGAYRPDSMVYGLLFYGWYDLLAAVMVTQFFMATQLYFDARTAKRFYPMVIAGGSLGATLGGLVTGLAAGLLGIPNLILLAAVLVGLFGLAVPLVTDPDVSIETPGVRRLPEEPEGSLLDSFREVFADRQVRLITASVLLTVLVKQLVDYQFNTITEEVYVTTAAISQFQGFFNAGTQWLPLVVLFGLRPALRRWGVGIVLFMLPVFMVGANLGLAASWSLVAAVVAKGGDTGIRYAAERTSREILYVPVPADLKMRAKGYIDVAVEKGVGKALSALMIFGLVGVMDYRNLGWVAAGLALVSVGLARAIHGEYLESLVRSFQDRVGSLKGLFASLGDATTLPVVQETLREGSPPRIVFALDLLAESRAEDVESLADDLERLLEHPSPEVRSRVLDLVAAAPSAFDGDRVVARLTDPERSVREAASRAWVALRDGEGDPVRELLEHDEPDVRRALLATVARGEIEAAGSGLVDGSYLERRWRIGDGAPRERDARMDVALAVAAVDDRELATRYLERLLEDPDAEVRCAALRSAGRLGLRPLWPDMVDALGSPATRSAAAEALAGQDEAIVGALGDRLLDETGRTEVRRHVPGVLARHTCQASVDVLLASYAAPETDQLLDYRTLKALNKLRSADPELAFERETVLAAMEREFAAARRYARAAAAIPEAEADGPAVRLLRRAVGEAWEQRRESSFRCLGLLHPPDRIHRCYLAVVRGQPRVRASAVEWLESTVGRSYFDRLRPVLGDGRAPEGRPGGAPGPASTSGDLEDVLWELGQDKDRWLTRCAIWAGAETGVDDLTRLTEGKRGDPADEKLRALARELASAESNPTPTEPAPGGAEMKLVEKVFLLQNVDLLAGIRSEHLALVAATAELVEAEEGACLLRPGEPPDALYVVVAGSVALEPRDASQGGLRRDAVRHVGAGRRRAEPGGGAGRRADHAPPDRTGRLPPSAHG